MIYVSMVEIMAEAREAFEESLVANNWSNVEVYSHLFLSLSFFGGIFIGYVLDRIVHALGHKHELLEASDHPSHRKRVQKVRSVGTQVDDEDNEEVELKDFNTDTNGALAGQTEVQTAKNAAENSNLIATSLVTALAIALHNFPEGLATFVSTLADPTLGVSIAFAIAIHNIPEGIAVAMPVYFATESKLRAFSWAFLSGIAEPIGGLVGYAIINQVFSDAVFGVLFGFTAGIMIYISFQELLPTARKRDVEDKYTTMLVFIGFLVMDISLILFEI